MNIIDNLLWVKYLKDGKEVTKDINDLYIDIGSGKIVAQNVLKIITKKDFSLMQRKVFYFIIHHNTQ